METIMKNTTRNTLLITATTVALIAGAGLASAQETKDKGEGPAATHDQKAPAGKMDQHPGGPPPKSPAPTAQAPAKEKPAATAQAPEVTKPKATEKVDPAKVSESPNRPTAPSMAKDQTKSAEPAALSTEQDAKIRDTLRSGKAERLINPQFSITVGGIIPGTVHLYVLPVSVWEYAPQYRDYEYILVGDEILIVNPRTMRIVAVIAA